MLTCAWRALFNTRDALRVALLLALGLAMPALAHAEARLTLRLVDAVSGVPTAARVALRGPGGFLFAAPDAQRRTHETPGTGPFLHVQDSLVVDLPEALYSILAVRGTTGDPVAHDLQLDADTTVTLEIGDWIDPRIDGWYGGDPHVHPEHILGAIYPPSSTASSAITARAEGLDLMYLLDNDPALPGGVLDPPVPGVVLAHGEEYRNSFWGHTVLLGLDQLLTWEGDAGCCGQNHAAWPTLNWSLESEPVGVHILAHPHTTDTPAAPFAQWPGSGFARERAALALGHHIDAIAVASGSNWPELWALDPWLDALKMGARWAAVGESDSALDRYFLTPPGQPRTYVQVGGGWAVGDPALVAAWEEGLRQGASFATTGPVIREFEVGGSTMGETLVATPGSSAMVSFAVSAATPIRRLTLHGEGGVVASWETPGFDLDKSMEFDVQVPHDRFLVLEVEAAPAQWPHSHAAPRAVSSPVWIDTGVDWPLDPSLVREQIEELEDYWELAVAERGFLTPADSVLANEDILGAADQYESMVDDAPGAFSLLEPEPVALVHSTPVTLRWSRSTSLDLEPVLYRLELATDVGFSNVWLDTTVADTVVVLGELPAPETHFWRVHALEPVDESTGAGGSPRSFWYSGGVVAAPESSARTLFLSRPERAAGGFDLRLHLERAGDVRLRWVDVRGRELRSVDLGRLTAGVHPLRFQAADRGGHALANGIYWLVATTQSGQAVRRVIWLR